jgi:hypothetical protein
MSVAILIEFKEPARQELYIPVATQGAYSSEWVPAAEALGLTWLPLFLEGTTVSVDDLPTIMEELQRLRALLGGDPAKAATVDRIDFILGRLRSIDSNAIAGIFVG